jgi:hypothetical protein
MARYLKVELEELREHNGHDIMIDSGNGPNDTYQYDLWCITCQTSFGTTLKFKTVGR